ncbi:MAG: alpha/beta hydrolase [Pseudomonadota bacterium]
MSWAGLYTFLAIVSVLCTVSAIVKARKIRWLAPFYFLTAWLSSELALVHIVWQMLLTLVFTFSGVLNSATGQFGVALFVLSWLGLLYLHCEALNTPRYFSAALSNALGQDYRLHIPPERQAVLTDNIVSGHWLRPFRFKRRGVNRQKDIRFGDAGRRNYLDIYQPAESREGGYPVLLQVHGGAWTIGNKENQGLPLMHHMAERGWLCVAINYRLSPRAVFPDHIIDVKKAIAWIRTNIHEYGGNPDFIAITGGSAGGHLSSLAALTPNEAAWQPEFEEVDTTLQAAVPFYGVYDFLDRFDVRDKMSLQGFLENRIMPGKLRDNRELWDSASPLSHVSPEAPPMLIIHGTHDSLVWVEEARVFASTLQSVARHPVAYAELPGAQHAFEIFHSVRTEHTLNAVGHFLEFCHARWRSDATA